MKKNTFKKIASCLLVIAMGLSLAACGEEQQENRIEATTIADIDPIVDPGNDPNWEINTGRWISTEATEAPTEPVTEQVTQPVTEIVTEVPATTEASTSEPAPEGKYSYTIYGGITLSMDVNIDDWIVVNNVGAKNLKMSKLAESLGWKKVANEGISTRDDPLYVYKSGDMQITLEWSADHWGVPAFGKDSDDKYNKLSSLYAYYHSADSLSDTYYDYTKNHDSEICEVRLKFHESFEGTEYSFSPSDPATCLNYDEAVLICYCLWQVTKNPGKNPIFMSGCFDDFRQIGHLKSAGNGMQVIEMP